MPRRDRRHSPGSGASLPKRDEVGRARGWLLLGLVLVLLVAGAGAVLWRDPDLRDRLLGADAPAPSTPAQIPPPAGLDLPALTQPDPVATPLSGDGAAKPKAGPVADALAGRFASADLGSHVVARVAPLGGGKPLFSLGKGTVTPASTMKVLTSTAALATLGPDHRFATMVFLATDAQHEDGKHAPVTIVLVGGGDPYLASAPQPADTYPRRADVQTLARRTAAALKKQGRTSVDLEYDASLFSGDGISPDWEPGYVPEVTGPISALWVDRGLDPDSYGFSTDPEAVAADAFAAALQEAGIEVAADPVDASGRRDYPAKAEPIAEVDSAPVAGIVQHLLDVSDNQAAEVLAHQVGLEVLGDGSFAGGAKAVRKTLTTLGIPLDDAVILDGSGLSRGNRLSADTLVAAIQKDAEPSQPDLRAVIEGLPVAGFTGSLEDRFDDGFEAARGRVRAKTGTLTGVHALAGVIEDGSGHLYAFAFDADQVPAEPYLTGLLAQNALDEAAAALGACTCG